MTLVVVGLDAADYRLVQKWELHHLLLDTHSKLETFAHTKEIPITAEVWPAIATGKLPDEGGQAGQRGSDWSGTMAAVNAVARRAVPMSIRKWIGRYLRSGKTVEDHFLPADGDHAFENGVVYNWPGITPAKNWSRSESWLERLNNGEMTDADFFRVQMGLTGEEIGWALSMSRTWLPIVGTRCHFLDHAGHAWSKQPSKLRTAYERVNDLVGILRKSDAVTDLVVCSDHGMQTTATDDPDPGTHSWESMVSSTVDAPLPEHVSDVRGWLDRYRPSSVDVDREWRTSNVDTPDDHLRDLGYIE
jgi:hypothetical protein